MAVLPSLGRRLLIAGLVAAACVTAPNASAEPGDYPVVDGVVRDNVDMTHSPLTAAEFAGARDVSPAADYIRGIDVARYQHTTPIDWAQVAASGVRFVGVKATEGDYYVNDDYLAGDLAGAKAAGMYAFSYHFGTPNDSDALTQADYFLDRGLYARDGRTLYPALDMEWNPYDTANDCYDRTPAQMVAWIRDFVTEVQRRTGVPAIIYTSPGFWSTCTNNSTAFSANPLWIAHYGVTSPTMPAGWANWTFWQYSMATSVPGITGDVDGNYFSGTESALAAMATNAAGYTATTPARVLDTRTGAPVGSGGSVTVDLSGVLPATATAAVLNVTGIATAGTFVTVWPAGTTRPNASNLNLVAGEVRPNLVTVRVGQDRRVQLYNNAGNTHLLADLAGWYATDSTGLNTALSPVRVLDTRTGLGAPTAPLGGQGTVTLDLSAKVPPTATAVTINLTGVDATAGTFVSAWPTGQARPNASNLNLAGPNATPNLVTVKLGTSQSVNLFNNAGTVHLIADLAGYYTPDTGSKFVALAPQRLLDTRNGASWTSVAGGGSALPLTMLGPVPAGATGTVLNVTGITPTAATFVSVFPKTSATATRPGSSNLNLVPNQTAPNLVSVAVGPNADVWLYNNAGTVNLVADLAGYFIP